MGVFITLIGIIATSVAIGLFSSAAWGWLFFGVVIMAIGVIVGLHEGR